MARSSERVARDILSVEVPGGFVLLHVPSGRYLRANESAASIVGLLSGGQSPADVARRFAASVGVAEEVALADVRSVIDQLTVLERASARPLHAHRLRGAARLAVQWRRVPPRLRWPALQVAVLMAGVELGLRTLDLRRLGRLARTPLVDTAATRLVPPGELSRLRTGERRLLWAIEWIDGRWLTPVTCLRRALVTGFVLRHRSPVLRLGITHGGTTAHAWVEAEGAGYGMEDLEGVFAPPA